eukprot:9130988-Pyramimonas_sp.AAC.1
MFGHHICNLLFCTYMLELNMFELACLTYPIQVDAMSTMKMAKRWRTSLLDNLDHGLVILKDYQTYFGRAALLSRFWIHVQYGTLMGYCTPFWRRR